MITRAAPDRSTVYLTFDDGPNPTATDRILECLSGARVPAAFFMIGERATRFPACARQVAEGGHVVGNHTQHHLRLKFRGPWKVREEIAAAHSAIADASGICPRAFRPPYGSRSPFVASVAKTFGYKVIGWSCGAWDWLDVKPEEIRRRIRINLVPGAIILLHDGDASNPDGDRRRTVAALPGIIEDVRNAGLSFGNLEEVIG